MSFLSISSSKVLISLNSSPILSNELIKKIFEFVLPLMKMAAQATENDVDDAAVNLIEKAFQHFTSKADEKKVASNPVEWYGYFTTQRLFSLRENFGSPFFMGVNMQSIIIKVLEYLIVPILGFLVKYLEEKYKKVWKRQKEI